MRNRIIGTILALASIILLPYWVYLPILFGLSVLIPLFWEAIPLALLVDTLYGPGGNFFIAFKTGIITLGILILMLPLRDRLRWHL